MDEDDEEETARAWRKCRKVSTPIPLAQYTDQRAAAAPIATDPFREPTLLRLLTNPLYVGKVEYGGEFYAGEHEAIDLWFILILTASLDRDLQSRLRESR